VNNGKKAVTNRPSEETAENNQLADFPVNGA